MNSHIHISQLEQTADNAFPKPSTIPFTLRSYYDEYMRKTFRYTKLNDAYNNV